MFIWQEKLRSLLAFALGFFALAPAVAHAGGFAVYTHGASTLGQAGTAIAHGDDPTVIFYNPALLSLLPGTQVQAGTTLIFINREFRSEATGEKFKTDNDLFTPSTLYLSHRFSDKLSAGFGVFSPFGLGNDWGKEWEGRFIATNSELKSFNFNPAVSLRLTPRLAVAGGIDLLYLDATLEKQVRATDLGILIPGLEIGQKFTGDGTGWGFNLGLLFDLTDDLAMGISYRSEIEVETKGKASLASPLDLEEAGKADLTLPQQAFAGLYYRGFDPLTFELGLRWEGWSSFDELRIEMANLPDSVSPRAWKDSFTYNLGARYRLNPTVTLLAGYLFGKSPVPDHTFDPTIPDADTHLFSLGTDLEFQRFKVALSYAYQRLEKRTKDNLIGDSTVPEDLANGTYRSNLHLIAAGLTYRF
jgi:long-chain fatty acid transport protein